MGITLDPSRELAADEDRPALARGSATAPPGTEAFLLDYLDALHSVAVPIPEIEERVHAVGRAFGVEASAFLLQSVAVLTARQSRLRRIDAEYHWNLRRMLQLRELTQGITDGFIDLPRARSELSRIMTQPARFSRGKVVLAFGVYGAVVTARVGGAWREVAVGVLVGLVAGFIHVGSSISRPVDLLESFLATLAGGLVALALTLVMPEYDFARSLFGGICLTVPAMTLTIGTYEVANNALEGGLFRLVYSGLRFLMMAVGLAVALRVWKPVGGLPDHIAAALPWPVVVAWVVVGGLVLTVVLQARARDVPWVIAGAVFAFGAHLMTKVVLGGDGSPLLAALLLGLFGFWYGRSPGHAAGVILIPGLLQLAPGFVGTEAVMQLLRGRVQGEVATFFNVGMAGLQLVVGLMLAALIFNRKRRAAPSAPEARRLAKTDATRAGEGDQRAARI